MKKFSWKKIGMVFTAACVAGVMAFALAGCGGGSSESSDSGNSGALRFVTGGESGTYYAFGSVIAQHATNEAGVAVTALAGNGSQANVMELQDGNAELAFCQSDVMAYAYEGTNLFEETGKVDCFSTVACLYDEQVQIVTLSDDIKTVADLKGKNVSIGAAGSGVYFNAIDILGAYGLTEQDITPTYESFADSANSLKDGKIDAAFIVAGAPTTAVTSLATTKNVYLVSLDDEHIDALIAESPFYAKAVIPAATYNMPEDATTVAVSAVVIASNDVADVDVYNFLCGVFENLDSIAHDKANELSLEFASSFSGVPYHSGAVQYFADKGITVE